MIETVFVTSLLVGIASLIGAISVARLNWRHDVLPFSRHSNAFKVLAHPEQFTVPSATVLIRVLTFIGYAFVGLAIICVGFQFLMDFTGK